MSQVTHTFIWENPKNDYRIYESGTVRRIGNGTTIVWGHDSRGHAHRITSSIKKQIAASDAQGRRWKKGQIKDSAFGGVTSGYTGTTVNILVNIRTFLVKTSCTNCTITKSNRYMAAQNVKVSYNGYGKKIKSITIDCKKLSASNLKKHQKSYTFKKLSGSHIIRVVY